MKIILSRKGFDSGEKTGGMASPIMPCGKLLSLPIPVTQQGEHGIHYNDLTFDGQSLSEIIRQLSMDVNVDPDLANRKAHLDPDLDRGRRPREPGWQRVFGQTGTWQKHLRNEGIREEDLFLFYGWFRQTELFRNELRYRRPHRDMHVIFGWLQIGKICRAEEVREIRNNSPADYQWLQYHPHVENHEDYGDHNTIYIAAKQLTLGNRPLSVRGAGMFPCFKSQLLLTAPEETRRTYWRLPRWFYPSSPSRALSCHRNNMTNWVLKDNYVFLRSQPRGQEFVLDADHYPEAFEWVMSLFKDVTIWPQGWLTGQ